MNEVKKEFKGNLGMFLVCAELSKLNLIALPTSRNTKGYDILVMNPANNKATGIQVKCSDKGDYPVLSSHWADYEDTIESKILCHFVFVDVKEPDSPAFFVVPREKLKDILKSSIKRYLARRLEKDQVTFEQLVQKTANGKPNLWALKLVEVEAFRKNWAAITDSLQ